MKNTPANLRFRRAADKAAALGQVATPPCIVERLLEDMPRGCRRILDLGAGDGRLARAALRHVDSVASGAHDAVTALVEVDEARASALRASIGANELVLQRDVLRDPVVDWGVDAMGGPPDAVLSNPPFLEARLSPDELTRVRSIFPFLYCQRGWVRADVVFAAYAWFLSAPGSFIGLILPGPAITLPRYRAFREVLVSQLEGLTVSQLPSRVFQGAEVDAFLVTGIRAAPGRRNPVLRQLDRKGEITATMTVDYAAALERLDFTAHRADHSAPFPEGGDTLESLGVSILRGSMCRADYVRAGLDAFHVTDFPATGATGGETTVRLSVDAEGYRVAEEGDVLIPRFGSRCLTRETQVAGRGVFTDSVYRLRGKPEVMRRVWRTLNSEQGRAWRASRAVGSCAKHLPLWVLKDMPVAADFDDTLGDEKPRP